MDTALVCPYCKSEINKDALSAQILLPFHEEMNTEEIKGVIAKLIVCKTCKAYHLFANDSIYNTHT